MSELAVEGGVPAAPEPVAPEPVAEPAWAGPSQDEWESTQQQLAEATALLQQLQQPVLQAPQQQERPFELDIFGDDPTGQIRELIQRELAPYQQFQQNLQVQEGTERAMDVLNNLALRDGEFDKDMAWMRANQIVHEYGDDPRAAEKALEAAAKQQREYEQKLYENAVARHTNQLKTLSGAPMEPGATYQQGTQVRTMPNYREGGSVTANLFGPNRS